MRQERESCCDNVATRLCGDPLTYAETLARLERLRSPGPLVLAGSGGRLKTRIERLVGVQGQPAGSPLVTFGLAVGLVSLLGVAGVMAQSGGMTPDASPVASPTLPERSLWVDILGDVTFTDDYLGVADVGEDGLFCARGAPQWGAVPLVCHYGWERWKSLFLQRGRDAQAREKRRKQHF